MMKKMKRVLGMFLAAAMSVTLLAGCGDQTATTTEEGTTEIVIWTNWSHSKGVFTKLVDEYNATTGKEKGIKIVYEVREGDSGKDIELAFKSGQAPDIFQGLNINKADDGLLLAIDDLEGGTEFLAPYEEQYPDDGVWKGKRYFVPFSVTTRGLIYNKDMFKAAGIVDENGEPTPPETWDELREYAKRLTNVDKNEFGIVFPMKWGTWFTSDIVSPAVASVGYNGYNPATGTYDYTYLQPVMETIMGIKEDGSYFPGAEGLDNDPARARFAEGGIGIKFAFSWDVGVLNDQFPAKCDWGVAPYPTVNKDEKYLQIASTNKLYMNAKSAEEKGGDKIFEVYKWLHSDEVATQLYLNCCELPPLSEKLLTTEGGADKKGWKEFAEMVDISMATPKSISTDTTGQADLKALFVNKVWSGEMEIAEALKQYTDTMNNGIKAYKEIHPDYDGSDAIVPDWDARR